MAKTGSEDWFYCEGYRESMTLFRCIENQLSPFCLPGFPCHECQAALTIKPAPVPSRGLNLKVKYPADWFNMTPAVRRSYMKDA